MSATKYEYQIAMDASDYVAQAVSQIETRLRAAINLRGKASFLVSGGSSPKPVYEALNTTDVDWGKVTVSLVDERWVPEGAEGSNASFIKDTLLQGAASRASFVPLVNQARTAKAGAAQINAAFDKAFPGSIDIAVMGMGTDGHTASWFPQSPTLSSAFDIHAAPSIVWQDATGQSGGSGFNDRVTVTLPRIMETRYIFLLIPGIAKKQVWDNSEHKDVFDAPVTTLRAAGPRLHVITHEGQ